MSRNRPFTVGLIGLTLLAAGAGCAGPNRRMNLNLPRLNQIGPMLGMGKAKANAEAPLDAEPAEGTWAMAARDAGPIPGGSETRIARRSRSEETRRSSEEVPHLTQSRRRNDDQRRGETRRDAVQPPVDFTDAPTIRPALGAIDRDRDEPAPEPNDRAQAQPSQTDPEARALPTLDVGLTLEAPQAAERRLDPETRPASRRAALPEALPAHPPANRVGGQTDDAPHSNEPRAERRSTSEAGTRATVSPFPEPRRPRARLFRRAEMLRRLFSRPATPSQGGSNERVSPPTQAARADTLEARADPNSDWLLPEV